MREKNLFLPLFLTVLLITVNGCKYPLLLLSAIAAHETAHIIAAAVAGAKISFRRFLPVGLVLEYDCHLIHPAKEALIASAGIAANGATAVGCAIFGNLNDDTTFFLFSANAVLGLINFLPIIGFDGAVILERLLALFFGPLTAARAVSSVSDCGAVIFTLFSIWFNIRIGVNISMIVLSVYLDFMLLTNILGTAHNPSARALKYKKQSSVFL